MNGHSLNSLPSADDTIEIQLTPEQLLGLSQAAEPVELIAPAYYSPRPLFKESPSRRSHCWRFAKMVGVVVAYFALAWLSATRLAGQPNAAVATANAVVRPVVRIPAPISNASSASQPAVRVANPFDKTEVFQFPAGTSHKEGREKVAQILLQRARERQRQWDHNEPDVSLRTASLYRQP